MGSYIPNGSSDNVHGISRLNSQLSFTRQDSLSQITEESEDAVDGLSANGHRKAAHSYATASFGMGSWDDTNGIKFSGPPSKRAKSTSSDSISGVNILESQFGLPQTTLDMATMDKFMDIPQDSVPCKIRAKRGCATHPRSIAERERRTRISGKLKKLQDLVPNMDKTGFFVIEALLLDVVSSFFVWQTSYSDMLDLAVQHIKGLQTEVQVIKLYDCYENLELDEQEDLQRKEMQKSNL
ncbi:hypothetical protein RJ640_022394 [Escallonia rubra]|uniref:BHLH domain-containing protein n=1 Tax=Escallonia rubra TaxID=112253 RepID=A0AA88RVB2_9ASTE|nr:hypothetical protein RJ640_022394 [Escallonia rubra]